MFVFSRRLQSGLEDGQKYTYTLITHKIYVHIYTRKVYVDIKKDTGSFSRE